MRWLPPVLMVCGFSILVCAKAVAQAALPSELEDPECLGINKQPAHATLMPYGNLKGDAGAVTEPEDVCPIDFQVSKESRDIIRGGLKRNGGIAIGRAAVTLFFHGDDPAAAGKNGEHSAERDINRGPAAVK